MKDIRLPIWTPVLLSLAFSLFSSLAAETTQQGGGGGGEANPELATHRPALEQWQDLRFGMFIHWGPVSLRGTEVGWSRGREVPFDDYDTLYREFNPVLFDASAWVATARAAGMKYLILVTKHHDGFTLWDSDATDYDMMSTPSGRDLVGELSRECRKQGLLFGTYYSILDWHHPDYPLELHREGRKAGADMPAYIAFMKQQLSELIDDYGTRILWFDGEWEDPWTHQMGMDLYAWAREQRDDLLINNRVDKGREGMDGVTRSPDFAGDFETPEQRVGRFAPGTPWESCITIGEQWAWKPNDDLKSLDQLLETLVLTSGGGGNLLLNVGPMLDGRMEARQVGLLEGIGRWLEVHGEAVYGTRGGPVPPGKWGATTRKEGRIFVHLIDPRLRRLKLNPIEENIVSARLLSSGEVVPFQQEGSSLELRIPAELPDPRVNVIELRCRR